MLKNIEQAVPTVASHIENSNEHKSNDNEITTIHSEEHSKPNRSNKNNGEITTVVDGDNAQKIQSNVGIKRSKWFYCLDQ